MTAIMKREFKGYFKSMLGYTFLTIFMFLSGGVFVLYNLVSGTTSMSNYFIYMMSLTIFILPILTMRMFSEDKKLKTDQLLLTAPISITDMVLGKFLAALGAFGVSIVLTLIYPLIMSFYAPVPFAETLSLYVGFMLFCMLITAIGSFMSSITENQIVAAISTYCVMIFLLFMDMLTVNISNQTISKILLWISPFDRFDDFAIGVLNIEPIIYYISMTAMFLFLTVRVFEKKRWA